MTKLTVVKRDGREVSYDIWKITNAIRGAFNELNKSDRSASAIAENVDKYIRKMGISKISVEEIQDLVETELMRAYPDVAKAYILYRKQRSNIRNSKTEVAKAIDEIINIDAENSDLQRENANIDANTGPGSMLKIAGTVTKNIALNTFHSYELANLHRSGAVHEHDLDFSLFQINCLSIPLDKILKNGFATGHGYIRPPQNIQTASTLSCIVMQSDQNDCFKSGAF